MLGSGVQPHGLLNIKFKQRLPAVDPSCVKRTRCYIVDVKQILKEF